jgi:hypothetical protein
VTVATKLYFKYDARNKRKAFRRNQLNPKLSKISIK